jgi:hypothetical protein
MTLTTEQLKTLDIELVQQSLSITRNKATRVVERVYELLNPALLNRKDFINLALGVKVLIENE